MVQAGRSIDGAAQWYDHDPERFEEFSRRYRAELEDPTGRRRCSTVAALGELSKDRTATLLTATKRPEISGALVLAGLLRG